MDDQVTATVHLLTAGCFLEIVFLN